MNKRFHIGQVIQLLRKKAMITQKELAEKIGKSISMVSHIEKTGQINKNTLLSISNVLKTSPEYLLNYSQHEEKTDIIDTNKLIDEINNLKKENELLWKFLQEKDKVINLLEQLKK